MRPGAAWGRRWLPAVGRQSSPAARASEPSLGSRSWTMPPKVSVLLRCFEHFQNIVEKTCEFSDFFAVAECQLRFGVPADSQKKMGQSEHAFRVDETHFLLLVSDF